jgi:hypothetical protein
MEALCCFSSQYINNNSRNELFEQKSLKAKSGGIENFLLASACLCWLAIWKNAKIFISGNRIEVLFTPSTPMSLAVVSQGGISLSLSLTHSIAIEFNAMYAVRVCMFAISET